MLISFRLVTYGRISKCDLSVFISRDVPIPLFSSQYLDSGYRPIPSTDPIPGCVSIELQFILALYDLLELFYGVLQTYPLIKHEQIHTVNSEYVYYLTYISQQYIIYFFKSKRT